LIFSDASEKTDLATPIYAAGRPHSLFTCKRGRGLRRSAQIWCRREQGDHARYDQKDLCVLFRWTGSISSDKSRLTYIDLDLSDFEKECNHYRLYLHLYSSTINYHSNSEASCYAGS